MQHVWLPRYVGEQLDLIFRYVGCLLSDFGSFICSGRNFFVWQTKRRKKGEFYSIQLGRFPTTCISNSQPPCLFKKKKNFIFMTSCESTFLSYTAHRRSTQLTANRKMPVNAQDQGKVKQNEKTLLPNGCRKISDLNLEQ